MPDTNPHLVENFSTFWSAVFVNELYRNGLRHVVLSPGSRSTPLTLAFAAHPHIKHHVVLDERSAAYIALGIGMKSKNPAAVVCTSGTAVANYLPAVVEARMSGVPMLILSADRPPNLRNIGANQAIRQTHIFGDYAVFNHDAGEPVDSPGDLRRLQILANQAWFSSIDQAGASHINFPFRKPLEPTKAFRENLASYYINALAEISKPLTGFGEPHWEVPAALNELIEAAERPVVVAGPLQKSGTLSMLLNHLKRSGIPTLAEAGASDIEQYTEPSLSGFNAFLKSAETRKKLAPDLIIRLGASPVGKGLELYLSDYKDVNCIRFETGSAWSDPTMIGGLRISVPPQSSVFNGPELPVFSGQSWQEEWKNIADEWIEKRNAIVLSDESFTDGDVYPVVAASLNEPHSVMISNSFAARDVDLFGMPDFAKHDIYMNRGASGIDGVTSTAVGLAIASEKPVLLITGDLAFLHDTTALLSANRLKSGQNLRIIVINNAGGSIFRMLPVYEPEQWFTELFETPQQASLPNLSAAFGLDTSEANTATELKNILAKHNAANVQVIICNTNVAESMIQRQRLWNELN